MRVFVTLGFERRPFDRLLKAVDTGIELGIIPQDTLVQSGYSNHVPSRCASVAFLSFSEIEAVMRRAEIIVAHAGVGTLLHCLHINKIPILFPRRVSRGEHVDDHQFIFARAIEETRRALVAYDVSQLFQTIDNHERLAAGLTGAASIGEGDGVSRLRDYIRLSISQALDRGNGR